MRIIPNSIANSVKSNAERKVFEALSRIELGEPATCYHSLRLSDHFYKHTGELDFVILTPSVLLVLEVKGGVIGRDNDGIWTMTDRHGVPHRKKEGPFEQASSGMYSLLHSIGRQFGNSRISEIGYGYGVLLPDCDFGIRSVEWADETVIDRTQSRTPMAFETAIKKLHSYWKEKAHNRPTLAPDELSLLQQFLRPMFDRAESIVHRVDELEVRMHELTDEQYKHLDAMDMNPRILCIGGGGTGKSFLAMEAAKRHADSGKKVLLACKSKVFANYVQAGARYSDCLDVLPLSRVDKEQYYDALFIDEAQDIMNMEDLSILDASLKGGLEKGVWRLFMDPNNQAGIVGSFDPEALEYVRSFSPAYLKLGRNCRNTGRIVREVQLLTAADIGVASAGDGPKVAYIYCKGGADAVDNLKTVLDKLLHAEVQPASISILSFKEFNESVASELEAGIRRRITVLDEENSARFPFTGISFATIADFKGFENSFIIVTDLDEGSFGEEGLRLIYVAMTRARAGLTFIIPATLKSRITSTLIDNLELVEKNI